MPQPTDRIKKELKDVAESDEEQQESIFFELAESSYLKLSGRITGPTDTPYEGGIFNLDIELSPTYPFNPPKIKFTTRIWHPNIDPDTGEIYEGFEYKWQISSGLVI